MSAVEAGADINGAQRQVSFCPNYDIDVSRGLRAKRHVLPRSEENVAAVD
jgi:hypothetical protein